MKNIYFFLVLLFSFSCKQHAETKATTQLTPDSQATKMEAPAMSQKYNELTPEEAYVIEQKGTERAGTGEYTDNKSEGSYICRKCNAELYKSSDKFDSNCGWPSFDDEIKGAVRRETDADGRRTEILCANCDGHLGHVFLGERFTDKNTRHCVNSISLKFIKAGEDLPTPILPTPKQKAIFASGCFWGTEYWLQKVPGIISVTSGYIGGHVKNPTYKQVCSGTTGHYEACEVIFNPDKVDFDTIAKIYFNTHNPEQANGQGPDIGSQYLPAIFYTSDDQKTQSEALLEQLRKKGLKPATEIKEASIFYAAEDEHQDYYFKHRKTPYCHVYKALFELPKFTK